MDTVALQPQKKKQVVNLVSHHKELLAEIEKEMCRRFLRALGYEFNEDEDITFKSSVSMRLDDGRVIISLNDQQLEGYRAICYLICGTATGGVNAVKLGALVLYGVYNISIFYSIAEYKSDERNKAHKVLRVLEKILDGSDVMSAEPVEASVSSTSLKLMASSIKGDVEESRSRELFPFSTLKRGHASLAKTSKIWVVSAINNPLPQDLDIAQLAAAAPNCNLAVEIIIGRKLLLLRDEFPNNQEFAAARMALVPDWPPRRCRKAQVIARFFEKFKAARGAALTATEIFCIQKHALERLGGYDGPNEDKLYEIIIRKLQDGKVITADFVKQCTDAFKSLSEKLSSLS